MLKKADREKFVSYFSDFWNEYDEDNYEYLITQMVNYFEEHEFVVANYFVFNNRQEFLIKEFDEYIQSNNYRSSLVNLYQFIGSQNPTATCDIDKGCKYYKIITTKEKEIVMEMIKKITEAINNEYDKYSKLYQDKFLIKPFISHPGGSKLKTINAIKASLEKGEDLLGEMLYPNIDGNIY